MNCNADVSKSRTEWRRRVFVSASPSSHSAEVDIAFNPKFTFAVIQCQRVQEGRLISMLILHGVKSNSTLRLCTVYAPNVLSHRRTYFRNLSSFVHGPEPTRLAGTIIVFLATMTCQVFLAILHVL